MVVVAGAAGKMGQEAVQAIQADERFRLAAVLVHNPGKLPKDFSIPVYQDAQVLLSEVQPDVWLDLTDARAVVEHADLALAAGARPVLGATGYATEDLHRWHNACEKHGIGGIAAPNFAIGALLMTRFAAEAARFYPHAEVIELHHSGKRDAPSGTARRTAQAMAQARLQSAARGTAATLLPVDAVSAPNRGQAQTGGQQEETESNRGHNPDHQPARGLNIENVQIHSVRLPGLVAHQEVLFGGVGEVLTIRHDSLSRASFMPGVLFSLAKVMDLRQFVYGLEHLLW